MSDLTVEELLEKPHRFAAWVREHQAAEVEFYANQEHCPLAQWLDDERKGSYYFVDAGSVREDNGAYAPLPYWSVLFIGAFDRVAVSDRFDTGRVGVRPSDLIALLDTTAFDWWQEAQGGGT